MSVGMPSDVVIVLCSLLCLVLQIPTAAVEMPVSKYRTDISDEVCAAVCSVLLTSCYRKHLKKL